MDFHKLMFLHCQRVEQNYYDFFPYKYGAYSYVLRQDKLRLTDLGYLNEGEIFHLSSDQPLKNQVDTFTQFELQALSQEVGTLRGNDLLRKVYLEYPYYATKSVVAPNILSADGYSRILKLQKQDTGSTLFSIGYEGISIDKYLDKLISNNVFVLVDVRKNPISRKYGFSKSQLQRYVESVGISYVHLPELGVPSELRQNLNDATAYKLLFKQYVDNILSKQSNIVDKLSNLIYEKRRVALTCFEADHNCCHRSRITEHFQHEPSFEIPIVHL